MADLTPTQEAAYSAIIDEILSNSDLQTISAKRIRKGLQERVEHDITPQKDAITNLIMARFDKFQGEDAQNEPSPAAQETVAAPTTNGISNHTVVKTEASHGSTSESASPTKRKAPSPSLDGVKEEDDDELSSVIDSPPPAKKAKKAKAPVATIETDEEIAKRMQAELNAPMRSTRGGGATKKKNLVKKSKTPKKKSKAKINSDDDSEVGGADSDKPEREKKGGFHKPMTLSEPLAALVGEPALSRPQTVKKIWAYVKERDLQDPSDKRQIRCDDAMRAVFKSDKIHMFTMNKVLAQHLHPADE